MVDLTHEEPLQRFCCCPGCVDSSMRADEIDCFLHAWIVFSGIQGQCRLLWSMPYAREFELKFLRLQALSSFKCEGN
jgi:hypothetical protein